MPGRKYSQPNSSYRYGFNGKENDNDIKGEGNQQDYGMRIYDNRLGRFLSVDPIAKSFPWNSSYAFAENDVIRSIDLDGLEKLIVDEYHDKYGRLGRTVISGIRDNVLKTAVEMNMMSGSNIRLTKQDIYIIRHKQDNSISFEGDGGNLTGRDIRRIASAPTVDGDDDPDGTPGTMTQRQSTTRGRFYRSTEQDIDKNEFFETQFPRTNARPTTATKAAFSNQSVIGGTFDGSTLGGSSSKSVGSETLSRLTKSIISTGKQFLSENGLNVGFVESITLTIPNTNLKGWNQLASNLASQFRIPRSSVRIAINKDLTSIDAGMAPGSVPSNDGSLHVDVNYSGVNNGNTTNALKNAITNP
jgi:RHS repeat-associated protein